MKEKILIVEDELIVATDLQLLLESQGFIVCGVAQSYQKAIELIKDTTPDIVFLDILLKGSLTGIDLAKKLKEKNIAFIYISANSNEETLSAAKITQPDGFIIKPYRVKELFITLDIAIYRHKNSIESFLRKEALFHKKLSTIILERAGWEEKFKQIIAEVQPFIPFDYIGGGFNITTAKEHQLRQNILSFHRTGFDQYRMIGIKELMLMGKINVEELTILQSNTIFLPDPVLYDEDGFKKLCETRGINRLIAGLFQIRSHLAIPLTIFGGERFYFLFFSRRSNAYTAEHIAIFNKLKSSLLPAIESMINFEQQAPLEEQAKTGFKKSTLLMPEVFKGIIGKSHLLLNVFDEVMQVAPVNTSVLILGESGTGKERIAESIHHLSPRKNQPLVKLNCATLPKNLIESELFGHEKGAFTGAIEKRIGKFEQADGGTIFLDEIGELPVDLQMKLLRVLQEQEIERIGGKKPFKIDVRVIAATNRNLEKEVAEGRFRLDLYYRLNTFPIELPPLRERKDDIPLLVNNFIDQYSRKTGKRITGISQKALTALESYSWPGNIRELEHLIERCILLTRGNMIENVLLPKSDSQYNTSKEDLHVKTILENERDHIIAVLKKCKGRIWGTGGAAELLNVPPTTLNSKIKKLGIPR